MDVVGGGPGQVPVESQTCRSLLGCAVARRSCMKLKGVDEAFGDLEVAVFSLTPSGLVMEKLCRKFEEIP